MGECPVSTDKKASGWSARLEYRSAAKSPWRGAPHTLPSRVMPGALCQVGSARLQKIPFE